MGSHRTGDTIVWDKQAASISSLTIATFTRWHIGVIGLLATESRKGSFHIEFSYIESPQKTK